MQGFISSAGNIDLGGQGGDVERYLKIVFNLSNVTPVPYGDPPGVRYSYNYTGYPTCYTVDALGNEEQVSLATVLHYYLIPIASNDEDNTGVTCEFDGLMCSGIIRSALGNLQSATFYFLWYVDENQDYLIIKNNLTYRDPVLGEQGSATDTFVKLSVDLTNITPTTETLNNKQYNKFIFTKNNLTLKTISPFGTEDTVAIDDALTYELLPVSYNNIDKGINITYDGTTFTGYVLAQESTLTTVSFMFTYYILLSQTSVAWKNYVDMVFNLGGGGGDLTLNVFAQSSEPTTKDGIWINTSATANLPLIENFDFDGVEISNIDYHNANNGDGIYQSWSSIPYPFYDGSAVAVGTDVYLLGSATANYRNYAYKYNTLANSYTRLTNVPYPFYDGSAVAVGTDIYLYGSSSSSEQKNTRVYDTLTNTYTNPTSLPYNYYGGSAVAIGTDVYLFGSGSSGNEQYAYKHDTLTDSYTRLRDIPYFFKQGSAVAIGTYIYLFGSSSSSYSNYTYRYNTVSDTYTSLTNIPINYYGGSAVAVGTDVYLFGSNTSGNSRSVYKYNTLTNRYTRLTDIPYYFNYGSAVAVGTDVYLLGGMNSDTKQSKFSILQLKNTYVYLFSVFDKFETQISNMINIPIRYACITVNNEFKHYPAYYGDGVQWISIP